MWNENDRKWLYETMSSNGVDTGSYEEFANSLNNKEDRDWYYNKSLDLGLDVGSAEDFYGMMVQPQQPKGGENGYILTEDELNLDEEEPKKSRVRQKWEALKDDGNEEEEDDSGAIINPLTPKQVDEVAQQVRVEVGITPDVKKNATPNHDYGWNAKHQKQQSKKQQKVAANQQTEAVERVRTKFGSLDDASKVKTLESLFGKPINEIEQDFFAATDRRVNGDYDLLFTWATGGNLKANELNMEHLVDKSTIAGKSGYTPAQIEAGLADKKITMEYMVNKQMAELGDGLNTLEAEAKEKAAAEQAKWNEEKPALWDVAMSTTDQRGMTDVGAIQRLLSIEGVPTKEAQAIAGELNMINYTKQNIAKARNMQELAKTEGNGAQQFVAGMTAAFLDPDTWTSEYELKRGQALQGIINKMDDEGEGSLTQTEQKFLESVVLLTAYNEMYNKDISAATAAGKSFMGSIPFMFEMAINPLRGTGKVAGKKLAKWAMKRFSSKTMKKGALVTGKAIGNVAGSAVAGYGTAGTMQLGDTVAGVQERMQGDVVVDLDEDGHLVYGGQENEKDLPTAVYEETTERMLDTASEIVGAGYVSMPFRQLRKWGRGTRSLGWIDNLANSRFGRQLDNFLEKTGWHGPIEEFMEEVHVGLLSPALLEDSKLKDFFNEKDLTTTLIAVAVPGAITSSLSTAVGTFDGSFKLGAQEKWKMQNADRMARALWGDNIEQWNKIKSSLDNGSIENTEDTLSEVDRTIKAIYADNTLTNEQKKAALEYAVYSLQYKTATGVRDAMTVERKDALDDMFHEIYGTSFTERVSPAQANKSYKAFQAATSKAEKVLGLNGLSVEEWMNGRGVAEAADGNAKVAEVLTEYLSAKMDFEGKRDRFIHDRDRAYRESDMLVDDYSNNGMIYTTRIDNQDVYITGGNVVLHEDGVINWLESSEELYVRMPDGKVLPIAPMKLIDKVVAVSAESVKLEERAKIDANFKAEFDAAEVQEDQTASGSPVKTASNSADAFTLVDNGIAHTVEVVAPNNDGMTTSIMLDGEQKIIPNDLLNTWREAAGVSQTENGEVKTENQIEVAPVATTATTEMQTAPVAQAETVQPAPKAAFEQNIPVDEKGKKMWEQSTPEYVAEYIRVRKPEDVEAQMSVVSSMIEGLEKQKSKMDAMDVDDKIAFWNKVGELIGGAKEVVDPIAVLNAKHSSALTAFNSMLENIRREGNEQKAAIRYEGLENMIAELGKQLPEGYTIGVVNGKYAIIETTPRVQPVEENNESTLSQTSDQVVDHYSLKGDNAMLKDMEAVRKSNREEYGKISPAYDLFYKAKERGLYPNELEELRAIVKGTSLEGKVDGWFTPVMTEGGNAPGNVGVYADNQGNPVDADGKLIIEEVASIDEITDEDFENPTRNVQLPAIPENVANAIGTEGRPVVIKKNVFTKNSETHVELEPEDSRNILSSALYNPNLVGSTQPIKRPDYKVAIRTGEKNAVVVLDVYREKDYVEIVGWRLVNEKGLAKMQRQAEREGGQFLILSPNDGSAAALSALPLGSSSASEDTTQSANEQENTQKSDETAENGGEKMYSPEELAEAKEQLGELNATSAPEFAARLFSIKPWKTLEEANAALKELLASYGETLNGQSLAVMPFLDKAQGLIGEYNKSQEPRSTEETAEVSKEVKPVKIEDVGEKIGGARKDVIRKYADKIKLDGKTFGTMFPKPEIDQLVEAGLPLDRVAAVKAMFDNAKREYERTKKRMGKDKALSASLFYAMYAKNVLNGETDNFDLKYNGWVFTDWGKEYMKANIALYRAVFEKLGAEYGKMDLAKYAITPLDAQHKKMLNLKALNESNARMQALRAKEKGEEPPVYKDGDLINFVGENHARPSDQFETLEEAVNAMVERIGKEVKPGAEALYKPEVYWKTDERGRADYSKIFVGVKVRGFGTVDLMEFKSSNEARQWLDEHGDDFQQMAAAKEVQVKAENKKPLPKYSIEYTLDRVNSQYAVVANFGRGKVHTLRTFDFPEDDARARMSVFKDEVMPFLNSQEAVQAANEYAEELQQKKSAPKNVVVEKNSRERMGVDWRNGQDATTEMFVDVEGKEPSVFGFRALEFGNYVSQKERQQYLNDIYDALMDMSEVLGVSPRALSLGGKLALAVGARGTSGASGHYEPYKNVINITKTKGAGVLAHEWLHALDRYFSNFDENALYPNGVRYATGKEYAENTRREIKDAFEKIMSAVRGGEYQKRSARLGDYWASDKELAARALQDYMMRKLDERGQKNDFLSNHLAPEDWAGDMNNYPFPLGAEADRIAEAFDNFFATVEEKTEDGQTVLFQQGMIEFDRENPAFERATENVRKKLEATGVKVKVLTKEEAESELARLEELADMQKRTAPETESVQDEHQPSVVSSAGKRKSPETALPEDESSFKGTAISSDDGAKILKDIDSAIAKYENSNDRAETFIGNVAKALGIDAKDKSSKYATFEAKNGVIFTIRISNHNATVSNFDNAGEGNGISIVISRKPNEGITNDGNAHLVEFFYPEKKISKADGKPLVEILKSIKQALYSGEYKDNTGLAQPEEVNIPEFLRTSDGTTYGWAVNGEIYLTPEGLNPNTPIHEYTHLWAAALQKSNPKLWSEVVEAMKLSPAWNEVMADENYTDIHGDDNRVASEVLSRLSGNEGYRRYMEQAEAEIAAERNIGEKVRKKGILNRIKNAVSRFWNWLKGKLGSKAKAGDGTEAKAEPWDVFVNKSLKDFDEGVNPDAKDSPLDRMFIGKKGAENLDKAEEATTRLDNLNVAREMESAGKDAKAVKLATGWERGADGKWRYETEDVKLNRAAELFSLENHQSYPIAESLDKGRVDFNGTIKLADLVNDEELFKAYPGMEKYFVSFEEMSANVKGEHDAENTMIRINKDDISELESTLVHEIQHAIQSAEGFAMGGSTETIDVIKDKARVWAWRNALKETEKEHPELAGTTELEKVLMDEYRTEGLEEYIPTEEQRIKGFNLYARGYDGEGYERAFYAMPNVVAGNGFATYRRLAGEVESRNVQERMGMSPEERRNKLAEETEDVSREDQIFMYDNLGVSASEVAEGAIDDVKTQPLTFEEQITEGLLKVSAENKENFALRASALRQLGQDLKDILKRMMSTQRWYDDLPQEQKMAVGKELWKVRKGVEATQRTYDKSTVDQLVKLAKMYFKNAQLMGEVSTYAVGRVLAVINNVVGKKDIMANATKLMDILLESHSNSLEGILEKAEKVKAKKVNAAGVEVMGSLDVYAQETVDTYKAHKDWDVEELSNAVSSSLDDLGEAEEKVRAALKLKPTDDVAGVVEGYETQEDSADDAVKNYKTARAIYKGMLLAEEYRENVHQAKKTIDSLKKELIKARGTMSKAAMHEFVKSTNETIMETRIELIDALHNLIYKFTEDVQGGRARAKAFVQAQVDRAREIQHNANNDMEGISADVQGKKSTKWNNSLMRGVMSSTPTFQTMLKKFGEKAVDGKGYLYERFIPQATMASEKEFRGQLAARVLIDTKLKELYGKKADIAKFAKDLNRSGINLRYTENGVEKTFDLTKGQMLYIYMANKMSDGKMKLRKMGITEEMVANIQEELPDAMVKFADWVQDELLADLRERYNKVHERMFGAPMAAIENYFPLKIKKEARGEKGDVSQQDTDNKPSTMTGSIIKRTKNSTALDLSADALAVLLEHIDQMEHWAAYAEFNRDLNTLLNYRHFQNQVKNMSSVRYGSGDTLWKNFQKVAQIASGTYQSRPQNEWDRAVLNFSKGIATSKIAFRGYTALKQLLSAPAFWNEAGITELAHCYGNPMGSWNWALENLPGFKKRWEGQTAGNEKFLKSESDWKLWHTKAVEKATEWGMKPNAFVDAVTVAVGARAVYETKLKQFKEAGYTVEKATQKALQAANEAYNESQQSSEGVYLSPIQADSTAASAAVTTFKNSNFGFTRKTLQAAANLKRKSQNDYKESSIEFMKKKLMRDGLSEEQAEKYAKKLYKKSLYKDVADLALFGFGLNLLWELGGAAIYLFLGDDDDEKEKMIVEAGWRTATGVLAGMPGGDLLADVLKASLTGEWDYVRLPMLVAAGDIESFIETMRYDKVKAANDFVNMLVAAGVHVNPQTLTDVLVALFDGDGWNAEEIGLFAMRFLNAPQSQLDKLEVDKAMENSARDLTEVMKRYVEYKHNKATPLTGWMYSDENEQKALERYAKRFDKLLDERFDDVIAGDAATFDTFYNNATPEKKEDLADKRKAFLNKGKEKEFVKLSLDDIVNNVSNGETRNEVYSEYSTAEDIDSEIIINQKRTELKPVYDALLELPYSEKAAYRKENEKDIILYKKLKKKYSEINKLKKEMKDYPEGDNLERMNKIREKMRTALDLINNNEYE